MLHIYFSFIYFSCAVVNCCLSSGVSALVTFVSFLCTILASAFYKYSISRERILLSDTTTTTLIDNDDHDNFLTTTLSTMKPSISSPLPCVRTTNSISSLSEVDILIDQNINDNEENDELIFDNMIIDTTEDSEEEICQLFSGNNIITTDFMNQIKISGL